MFCYLKLLSYWVMDERANLTHIALIPKKKNPEHVSEFRPISLCNVVYKVISKVLANRLKVLLLVLISPLQSAFILGRLITDNILAAYETLHSMQTMMWGNIGFMRVKLDMSKAYDRVEWAFLEAAMVKMGFHAKWCKVCDLFSYCQLESSRVDLTYKGYSAG
jgi:hypothetical protein